jgi:hypothetical protein
MTDKQPKALVLADKLESAEISYTGMVVAAAELRRLHEAHDWQYTMAGERLRRIEKDETLLRQALECLTYRAPYEDCIDAMDEYERKSEETITAIRARLNLTKGS